MVIHDLHVVGVAIAPDKADSPLIVDADAVLALAVASQPFETIPRGSRKVAEFDGGIKDSQFPSRHLLEGLKALDPFAAVQMLRIFRAEALDHTV